MRFGRTACTLLLLLLAGGCSLHKRTLTRYLTPARLDREVLTLEFFPDRIRVEAVFHFYRPGKPEYILCMFPGAGYPVRDSVGTAPHPPVRNFLVLHNGYRLPVTSRPGKQHLEFPARFEGKDTYTIRYQTPWQMDRGVKSFGYVLRTGGLWESGQIGSLRIIIINRTGGKLRISSPYNRQRIFKNFKPLHDLTAILQQSDSP